MVIVDLIRMELKFEIQTMINDELQDAPIENVIIRGGVNLKE